MSLKIKGGHATCYLCGNAFTVYDGQQQLYLPVDVCGDCAEVKRSAEEIGVLKRKHKNEVDESNAKAEFYVKVALWLFWTAVIFMAGVKVGRHLQ
jgi:hypothetical protein